MSVYSVLWGGGVGFAPDLSSLSLVPAGSTLIKMKLVLNDAGKLKTKQNPKYCTSMSLSKINVLVHLELIFTVSLSGSTDLVVCNWKKILFHCPQILSDLSLENFDTELLSL